MRQGTVTNGRISQMRQGTVPMGGYTDEAGHCTNGRIHR